MVAYTYKFRDPSAKADVVKDNTVDMMFAYFWSEQQVMNPNFFGLTISEVADTRAMMGEWVEEHPDASMTEISDFISSVIYDYKEHKEDIQNDR
jgi:hypothetical protein